jgi:hypothetical protein
VKNKQRLVVLFGALAALIALLAVVPVFGADATQRFPSPDDPGDSTKDLTYSRQGTDVNSGAPYIILEVTDADLDVGFDATSNSEVSCDSGDTIIVDRFGISGGTSADLVDDEADKIVPPILDRNDDGGVNFSDVEASSTSNAIQVDRVDALSGAVTLRCTATQTDTRLVLTYTRGEVDKTAAIPTSPSDPVTGTVRVTSDAHVTGMHVQLEETSEQSGVFRGYLKLIAGNNSTSTRTCLDASCTIGTTGGIPAEGQIADGTWSVGALAVNESDTVVFSYVDETTAGLDRSRTASIRIESAAPSFTNPAPAHGISQANNLPTVSGDVTDSDSGVDNAQIIVVWGIDSSNPLDGRIDQFQDNIAVHTGNTRDISDGYRFEEQFPARLSLSENHVIYWWVSTIDAAGNVGISDRQPVIGGNADTCDAEAFNGIDLLNVNVADSNQVKGCQPYSIAVDRRAPDMEGAVTGSWWDPSLAPPEGSDDRTQTDVTKSLNTSIRVDFDGALNDGTVQLTDFEVDDSTPLDIAWYPGRPQSVFLTVSPLDPKARPKIEVVGEVQDAAGNKLSSDTLTNATDGIAPTLALSPTDRPVTRTSVEIMLSSNENASTATVRLEISLIGDDTTVTGGPIRVPVTGGPTAWKGTITPPGDGLYNVYAEATDVNVTTNTGSAGTAVHTSDASGSRMPNNMAVALADAVLFEKDTRVPDPMFLPAGDTDDANTIVSVNYADEGREYGLMSDGTYTNTATDVATSFDSHKTVTVVSATLDDADISDGISTADNVQFLHKPAAALAEGEHTIKIKVMDEAGNEAEVSHTFKVVQRTPFSVPLVPGWNMVSFPADPADPTIDAVVGGSVPVTVVMTLKDGVWLTATRERGADGTFGAFVGALTEIDSGLGYWVFTSTFEPIMTVIPRLAGGAVDGSRPPTPPTVKIVQGWNIVSILDVTGDKTAAAADDVDADAYFSSAADSITRIYDFDTQLGKWSAVALDGDDSAGDKVRHGKSYWVYSTKAVTLSP